MTDECGAQLRKMEALLGWVIFVLQANTGGIAQLGMPLPFYNVKPSVTVPMVYPL